MAGTCGEEFWRFWFPESATAGLLVPFEQPLAPNRKIPIVEASMSEPMVMIVRLDLSPLCRAASNFFGSVFACKLSCVNCAILASRPGFPSYQSTWQEADHFRKLLIRRGLREKPRREIVVANARRGLPDTSERRTSSTTVMRLAAGLQGSTTSLRALRCDEVFLMRFRYRLTIMLVGLLASSGWTSDAQSLGDLARQQRQKQQPKQAHPKVITNEDLPKHPDSSPPTDDSPSQPTKKSEAS